MALTRESKQLLEYACDLQPLFFFNCVNCKRKEGLMFSKVSVAFLRRKNVV